MKNKKNYLIALLLSAFYTNLFAQQLTTTGAMNQMGKTGFAPVIWLDTLSNKSHLYALGPYEKLQGEITVVDGKPFYVTAYEKGKSMISQSWDIKSPFFVKANVESWESFKIDDSISSVADIQAIVAKIAQANGYETSIPFPFKIEGVLDEATFHIVTPRSSDVIGYRENVKQQLFTFSNIKGQIIGFYSEKHQGVFTGSKSFIHVHFLKDDQTFMGHLDKIKTGKSNLKLYLPSKSSSSSIRVNDSDFSKGRLGLQHQINLKDLEKFHGHLCDGLVVGHLGLKEGLKVLYPNGVIDRTNTRIVSKSSPCLTDAAIYLTGGRYQFNSFYVSNEIKNGIYIIQRKDNGKAVSVQLNKGIKPAIISEMGAKAAKGELSSCELDDLKALEDEFSQMLLSSNPEKLFTVTSLPDFKWEPELQNDYVKTDVLNKNVTSCNN